MHATARKRLIGRLPAFADNVNPEASSRLVARAK